MLDVASLEKFDFLNNFVLAAGHNGLSRTISNVVILDHEGIDGDFSDFRSCVIFQVKYIADACKHINRAHRQEKQAQI